MSILNYQNLTLTYNEQEILHHIDLIFPRNQITVIVGQSGSGKSTLLKATIGLLSDDAKITEGKILFKEDNLLKKNLDGYRGKEIGMIFQNPLTYLMIIKILKNISMKVCIHILNIQKNNHVK